MIIAVYAGCGKTTLVKMHREKSVEVQIIFDWKEGSGCSDLHNR